MKKWSIWILMALLAALPLTAQEFPLCVYGANDTSDLKIIKEAGFTCLQTYKQDPQTLQKLAKEAKKQGLKVIFYPNKVLGTKYEKKAQKWPILAWYLVDEPEVHKWSRERVQEAHSATKKAFPEHKTALVISEGRTYPTFCDLPDIMMVDWYPVPHYPLETFGDQVSYLREEMEKHHVQKHPAWGVVQIFDWKHYKQYRPDNDRIGRFPTEDEIRFMSYDGIFNGADGLFFFTFNYLKEPMYKSAPEYWQRVKNVVQELAQFKLVLEQGTLVNNPVRVREPLRMKSWQYQGHTYSLLENIDDKPRKVPSALLKDDYQILYGQEKTKKIPPYSVWILKK